LPLSSATLYVLDAREEDSRPARAEEVERTVPGRPINVMSKTLPNGNAFQRSGRLRFTGMHILLIEDDVVAAEYLLKGIGETGHIVDHAADGETGLTLALNGRYDVIVVDRMLPGRDGLTIIRMLRADRNDTPVLVLSALGEVDSRVEGLRAGGDDYLVKPYAFSELLARLDALARRNRPATQQRRLQLADLVIDSQNQSVTRAGRRIHLQPREFRLLEYLMRNAGRVVTRTMLLEQLWDFHFDPKTNVIDVHISRLRGKIDKGFDKPLLHTVHGAGYLLSESH
jgi:two-component system OmpR family response regulator